MAVGSELTHDPGVCGEAIALSEVDDDPFAVSSLPTTIRSLMADQKTTTKLENGRVVESEALSEEEHERFSVKCRTVLTHMRRALGGSQWRQGGDLGRRFR
jgi:hypothetical protein